MTDTILPNIYIKKLIANEIDFENDLLKLYIVDRKLKLNKKLSYKQDIVNHILYSKQLKDVNVYHDKHEIIITYGCICIEFDLYKYPTLGNVVICNETKNNFIMMMTNIDENNFTERCNLLDKIIGNNKRNFVPHNITFNYSKNLINCLD